MSKMVHAIFMDRQGEEYALSVEHDAPPQSGETVESATRRWNVMWGRAMTAEKELEKLKKEIAELKEERYSRVGT